MNKTVKIIIGVVILVVIVWALAAGRHGEQSSMSSSSTATSTPIKIGAVLPMTGIAASYGENQFNAMKLAVAEINKAGGVQGRQLQIVSEDNATDPAKAVSATQKLINIDKVPVIVGGVWDFLANAEIPVTSQAGIVLISASVAPDSLEKVYDRFFDVFPPISIHQPVFEKYLKNEKGTRVAIIYINNSWGIAHRDAYKKAVTATGKTLVDTQELPKFDVNDIQRTMTLVKSKKPDVIILATALGDSKVIVEKNTDLGVNARIFGHDNIMISQFLNGTNAAALKGTVVYSVKASDPSFVTAYKNAYGKVPNSEGDKAYDAVKLIAKAIDLSAGDASSAGIASGLGKISNYAGASGPIDFTQSQWPTKDTSWLQMFDGKNWVPYN